MLFIDDVTTDPRTVSDGASFVAIQAGALVNILLMEQGRFVALFYMLSRATRIWPPEEIGFLRNLAAVPDMDHNFPAEARFPERRRGREVTR
jgi:GAF domain-containing protein